MGTKLKSSKSISKWIVGILSFLVIGAISGWLYSQYDQIEKIAQQQQGSFFESEYFYERLSQVNYGLYYQALSDMKGEEAIQGDDLFQITDENLDYLLNEYVNEDEQFYVLSDNEKMEVLKENLLPRTKRHFRSFYSTISEIPNLEYMARLTNGETTIRLGNLTLESLGIGNLSSSELGEFKNQYQYFVVINYDENGQISVSNVHGINFNQTNHMGDGVGTEKNQNAVASYLYSNSDKYQDGYELKIKNMTVVYAVPKILVYDDYISNMTGYTDWWHIQDIVLSYSFIAIALVLITAIILPIKAFRNSRFMNGFFKLPIEIALCLGLLVIPSVIELIPSLVLLTIDGDYTNLLTELAMTPDMQEMIIASSNILIWMLTLGVIFIVGVYLKNLFSLGFKTIIKTKFLTFNMIIWSWKKFKSIYHTLTDVDLKDTNTKKLALFLGLQFIIISILCATWFFGPFIAILYIGGLFIFLNKKLKKIQSDYSNLFKLTNELAEGNLDVQLDEDLGMFNSFKEEVVNIQGGLKKAVHNEVKSQRMKTDLIANVSHDLKTPLTSIITYVDLLKDENLTPEKREQYLETLDQKSQRLKVLIEDLFEMSKASSGNISMNLQEVDVVSLMKQTLLETEDKLVAANLVIRHQFPDYKVMLSLDSDRTYRVFENLILNMSKYAMTGTRAYVDIVDNEEYVEILFRNMSADEITVNVDELTERFVRGDQSRHTEGTGLGLAIAKSFVELQGGTFNIMIDGDLFKVIMRFTKS